MLRATRRTLPSRKLTFERWPLREQGFRKLAQVGSLGSFLEERNVVWGFLLIPPVPSPEGDEVEPSLDFLHHLKGRDPPKVSR